MDPEEQLIINEDAGTYERVSLNTWRRLSDGDIIRIATPDRELPLPSETLLFWHHYVWQILGSSALNKPSLAEGAIPGSGGSPQSTGSPKRRKLAGRTRSPLVAAPRTYDGSYESDEDDYSFPCGSNVYWYTD
ncbi:hypothetical protein TWF481_009281 [Arthrobotrys musiformis]|uniref:HNH nuclease domain-containing protein n=1 Tax=Arthrobotrys musiformis TaxID=47236 RepID=A0AAV9W4E8_9PEZI